MGRLVLGGLLLALLAAPVHAETFFIEQDKQKHMKYSAVATNLMYWGGMSKWQAFTTMMVVGAIKEQMDDNTEEEHHRDMMANMLGASTVFVWEIKF